MESKINLKPLLDDLKSSSSKVVLDSLLKIKNFIVNSDKTGKKFREHNGFVYLVPHLLKPNENILNITLSILGDLCLDHKSCLILGKFNIYAPLIDILNMVFRDSIIGRTARLIGNLARDKNNAKQFFKFNIVKDLMSIIEPREAKTSIPTLIMAVRAIRKLWVVEEKRNEMLNMNVVRTISILMTTECEKMGYFAEPDRKSDFCGPKRVQEDFITCIVKCIWAFSSYPITVCAEQIQGDGRGFQCLVILTKSNTTVALKCLTNLCFVSFCRPLLGMVGFIECFVEFLKTGRDPISWPDGSPMALAQLSWESLNRARLRRCGGLPLLVKASKDNMHAMNALLQYVFDDTSFQILIDEGVAVVLTEKLVTYVSSMEWQHKVVFGGRNNRRRQATAQVSVYDIGSQTISHNIEPSSSYEIDRRSILLSTDVRDDFKVVIERDNMLVGFVDAVESDVESDSDDDDEDEEDDDDDGDDDDDDDDEPPPAKMRNAQQTTDLIRVSSNGWSAGVFWEPKSLDNPPSSQRKLPLTKEAKFPDFNINYTGPGSVERVNFEWSPESGVSVGDYLASPRSWSPSQMSPSPSPPPSESPGTDGSDNYSPVCSDNGETTEETSKPSKPVEPDVTEIYSDESSDEEMEDLSDINIHCKDTNIACVMVLLFRISHGTCHTTGGFRDDPLPNKNIDHLTTRDCLNGLLDFVEKCKRPLGRAGKILCRVLSSNLCLLSVIKHRLVIRLYRMSTAPTHLPEHCIQCEQVMKLTARLMNQMSTLAESSYGVGKLSYYLLKANGIFKHSLALTIPYIVRTEKGLKKLLIDCKALDILISMMDEGKENLQECVIGLSKLAKNINIKDPTRQERRFKETVQMVYNPTFEHIPRTSIVTFKLDDSSTVRANKEYLCKHSEYFNAMFTGCFKESKDNRVRLKNVSKPGLEYLLALLDDGISEAQGDIQIFPLAPDFKTNLEVLVLADRFLFEKLKELLTSAILQFNLLPYTACTIYTWSLGDGMGFLTVETVAYILTGKMSNEDRYGAFNRIMNLEFREQFLEDIKSIICKQLVK